MLSPKLVLFEILYIVCLACDILEQNSILTEASYLRLYERPLRAVASQSGR